MAKGLAGLAWGIRGQGVGVEMCSLAAVGSWKVLSCVPAALGPQGWLYESHSLVHCSLSNVPMRVTSPGTSEMTLTICPHRCCPWLQWPADLPPA